MAITQKAIKILWANAAGRCSFSDCKQRLCFGEVGEAACYIIGEMAHICGEQSGSNRHNPLQTPTERDAYDNLILLCPNHHSLIDKPENEKEFTVELLQSMKKQHECFVSGLLDKPLFRNKHDVACYLYPLMKENHEVFINFGPHSEIARRNPESDAHAVWLLERLTTIIPNNRRMLGIADTFCNLFGPSEQQTLVKFSLHVRSYERWVRDEISYEGVRRFPVEFDALVSELALDCV
jgi:hypothetical protein